VTVPLATAGPLADQICWVPELWVVSKFPVSPCVLGIVEVTTTSWSDVTLLSSVTVTLQPSEQDCDALTCPVFAPAGRARPATVATATPATSPTRPARLRAIPKAFFTAFSQALRPTPSATDWGNLTGFRHLCHICD
jgi:hypothetical protein